MEFAPWSPLWISLHFRVFLRNFTGVPRPSAQDPWRKKRLWILKWPPCLKTPALIIRGAFKACSLKFAASLCSRFKLSSSLLSLYFGSLMRDPLNVHETSWRPLILTQVEILTTRLQSWSFLDAPGQSRSVPAPPCLMQAWSVDDCIKYIVKVEKEIQQTAGFSHNFCPQVVDSTSCCFSFLPQLDDLTGRMENFPWCLMEHLMGNLVVSRFTRWVAPVEKSPASYGVDPHFWLWGGVGSSLVFTPACSWKPMVAGSYNYIM